MVHERLRKNATGGIAGTQKENVVRLAIHDENHLPSCSRPLRWNFNGFARAIALDIRKAAAVLGKEIDKAAHLVEVGAVIQKAALAARSD